MLLHSQQTMFTGLKISIMSHVLSLEKTFFMRPILFLQQIYCMRDFLSSNPLISLMIFPQTRLNDHFIALLSALHFANNEADHPGDDQLWKFRLVFDVLDQQLSTIFIPNKMILLGFQGVPSGTPVCAEQENMQGLHGILALFEQQTRGQLHQCLPHLHGTGNWGVPCENEGGGIPYVESAPWTRGVKYTLTTSIHPQVSSTSGKKN